MQSVKKLKEQEKSFLQRYIYIICTIVLGMAGSFTLFVIVNNQEQKYQRIEFESRSRGYANALQNSLNEYLGALKFVADFFNNSSQMSRQQFSSLVKNALSRHPGIQAFSWNPLIMDKEREIYELRAREEGFKDFKFTEKTKVGELIRAAQRREYVVVYYIDPIEDNRSALGYDIISEHERMRSVTQVFNTGKPFATSRITLVQETGDQFGVLILLPIYQQGVSLNTMEERNKYRKGIIVEVLRIGKAVKTALADFPEEGIDLYLYDVSSGEEKILYSRLSHIPDMIDQAIEKNVGSSGFNWSANIEFAERKWKILFSPTPLYFDTQQSGHAWIVLSGSLLLTVTLAFYMFRRLRYIDEIENRIKKQLQTNKELEYEVTERKQAEDQIKVSLKEKEVLLKEIHHRVKNNMQIMASLLRIQSEGIKDKYLLDLFNESQNRIKSMALIHEDLYSGKDLARIDFDQYTRTLTARLIKSYEVDPNRIITSVNIDNVFLGVDTAIPCGLIINELFTNSLKYAFPLDKFKDKKGEIRIDCHSNSAEHTLVFSDNGVGFPEDIDFHKAETMGLDLIRTLVNQLGGNIELNRNNGTEFKITFEV